MSAPTDPMAEIRASFFVECDELLEALHDALARMEEGDTDTETVNVVFRAVHSIKGGAGAFELAALVRFAHRFETVLDALRSGAVAASEPMLKLFYQAADHLADLVAAARDGDEARAPEVPDLLAALEALLPDAAAAGEAEKEVAVAFQPLGLTLDLGPLGTPGGEDAAPSLPPLPPLRPVGPENDAPADSRRFRILFAPDAEMFMTGNDPALLLRNLAMLGKMQVLCLRDAVPPLNELACEEFYMSWDICLITEADADEIASVFEFVEGLCVLKIAKITEDSEPPLAGIAVEDTDSDADPSPADSLAAVPPRVADSAGAHPPDPPTDVPPQTAETAEPIKAPAAAPAGETGESPPPAPTPVPAPTAPPETSPPPQTRPASTAARPAPNSAGAANTVSSVVRVDLDRIERLVNLVGELVINQAMLSQSLEESGLSPHSDAMHGMEEFQRLTRDIQEQVMRIRAQPVKSLFQRMSRVVREAASAVGKDVRLLTVGETTEVDKTVIERLADPLTHMIRNAVDHGLEDAEGRAAADKPRQGVVTLSAAHASGRVLIEVRDDGAGINRPRVRQIAVDKGLIPADAVLTDQEIDNLLFLPGFSTADTVSDLSGRGVGMDVVRTAIQTLGGRISIASERGTGTCWSISLPLTLAVLDGMVVQAGGETLVLPLSSVVETLTVAPGDVQMTRPGRQVILARGAFVPLYDLASALGYGQRADEEGGVAVLVTAEDGSRFALLIDAILDQRQVVIKGLDESLARAPGIAAATILGDGQIALILEPADIVAGAGAVGPLPVDIAAPPSSHPTAGAPA